MGLPITIEPAPGRYRVSIGDITLGETAAAVMLHETGHGPVMYVPRADMDMALFTPTDRASNCPWKGHASYFSVGGQKNVVWSYERPIGAVAPIAGHLAFYPAVTVAKV